jgi:hypothetical protein
MTKILLCGLAGAGKTTTGEELAALGWVHFDCEDRDIEEWLQDPLADVPDSKNVVASWGFLPEFIDIVNDFVGAGFIPVWLYGIEEHLVRALEQRGEPDNFLKSPKRRHQEDGLSLITPNAVLNVFRPDGSRWDITAALHDAYFEVPDDS